MEAPVASPPEGEGLDVEDDIDVEVALDAMERSVAMVEVANVDGEESLEMVEILMLLAVVADSLMFHPSTAIAPTVDELTVSVLVVVAHEVPSSVCAHVPW